MNESPIASSFHDRFHMCGTHCIAWSAVIVGALAMVGLSFLFNLLSLSLGLSVFPTTADGKLVFAVGGFVALTIITIIIMFVGGWLAGYLGRVHCSKRRQGEIYGFTAWCLALIVAILLASQVGQFVSNYNYVISRSMPVVKFTPSTLTPTLSTATAKSPTTLTESEASALATATFVTFFLFAIGAISACFGGRNGMRCYRREMPENRA